MTDITWYDNTQYVRGRYGTTRHDHDGFQLPVLPAAAAASSRTATTPADAATLRKLYIASTLHGFSDACAKLSTYVASPFATYSLVFYTQRH